MLPRILIIAFAAMAALGLLISRMVLRPIKRLRKGAAQVAKGNYDFRFYSKDQRIDEESIRGSNELAQVTLAFEMMRRKVLELQGSLRQVKTHDLQKASDDLIEKEKVLQRAHAKLVGQSEELQKINQELSAKNAELSDANAKLQQLDQQKTDFILIAAHEIRTPIQAISGSVQLAQKGLMSNEKAWKTILSETTRLADVATYILDVSKIERGTFAYDMETLDVSLLVDDITYSASKFSTDDGGVISIKVDSDDNNNDGDDVEIQGDKDRLVQAFSNIIRNAARFARGETITVKTRSNPNKGMVEIKIVDDGPGIPAEVLPALFNKFVTKTPENERGTGLGLFITKAIIEAHKGTIRAENNSGGKGATFTVSLPLHVRQRVSSSSTAKTE